MSPSELLPWRRPVSAAIWCAQVLGVVMVTAAAFCLLNYRINLYGLFGKSAGLNRQVYLDEAQAKYLLAFNYIPANFDGLLIGTSITDNWDTSRLNNFRVYNASIVGGNISEEKLLADNVLDRGHIRIMIFCIYPYMTASHGRLEGGMEARQYWEGLGSLRLLYDYKEYLLVRAGRRRQQYDAFGVGQWTDKPQAGQKDWRAQSQPEEIPIDPVAYAEYASLVRRARSSGALLIRLIPPIYYEKWLWNRGPYVQYYTRMANVFAASDPVIDFNTAELEGFRRDAATFIDGIHVAPRAIPQVMSYFNSELERILAHEPVHLAKAQQPASPTRSGRSPVRNGPGAQDL